MGNKYPNKRTKSMNKGANLLVAFLFIVTITVGVSIYALVQAFEHQWTWGCVIGGIAIAALICSVIFWDGIIRVYMTSVQLGIKIRVIGILCGWIPIANIIALCYIIKTVKGEVKFETTKYQINLKREKDKVCETKYPLLLVHGVFFRDYRFLNYWGRIPAELEKNGAKIFYGKQQSAASVEECGKEVAARIEEIIAETGAEKVNIIGHSKGGLDSRYAISCCGMADKVASLTTINTPHRGCEFAEYLLSIIPEKMRNSIATTYNASLRKMGDHNPNFLEAVEDLTASRCNKNNEMAKDMPGVFYQSVGSKLTKASSGKFPLNMTHALVKYFDGPNDGLVSVESAKWGERFIYLENSANRGISHGDVIDLNRENIPDFDVREFYVNVVSDLKKMGL